MLIAPLPLEVEPDLSLLPSWRREQALRFRHRQGQLECAVSYLLLCKALHDEYGIDCQPTFSYGEHGKPMLVEHPDIHFNLSHCREAVACAVSHSPVGIDVERVGRDNDSLTRHVMCDGEIRLIEQAEDSTVEFTRLWTMKEALVKLLGTGITDELKQLLHSDSARDIIFTTHTDANGRYVCTIAETSI